MKKIVVIHLILLILLGGLSEGIQYALFKLNQDRITEQYCVNITKPEILCSGKCYYYDLVSSYDETPHDMVSQSTEVSWTYLITDGQISPILSPIGLKTEKNYITVSIHSASHITDLLRPPQPILS